MDVEPNLERKEVVSRERKLGVSPPSVLAPEAILLARLYVSAKDMGMQGAVEALLRESVGQEDRNLPRSLSSAANQLRLTGPLFEVTEHLRLLIHDRPEWFTEERLLKALDELDTSLKSRVNVHAKGRFQSPGMKGSCSAASDTAISESKKRRQPDVDSLEGSCPPPCKDKPSLLNAGGRQRNKSEAPSSGSPHKEGPVAPLVDPCKLTCDNADVMRVQDEVRSVPSTIWPPASAPEVEHQEAMAGAGLPLRFFSQSNYLIATSIGSSDSEPILHLGGLRPISSSPPVRAATAGTRDSGRSHSLTQSWSRFALEKGSYERSATNSAGFPRLPVSQAGSLPPAVSWAPGSMAAMWRPAPTERLDLQLSPPALLPPPKPVLGNRPLMTFPLKSTTPVMIMDMARATLPGTTGQWPLGMVLHAGPGTSVEVPTTMYHQAVAERIAHHRTTYGSSRSSVDPLRAAGVVACSAALLPPSGAVGGQHHGAAVGLRGDTGSGGDRTGGLCMSYPRHASVLCTMPLLGGSQQPFVDLSARGALGGQGRSGGNGGFQALLAGAAPDVSRGGLQELEGEGDSMKTSVRGGDQRPSSLMGSSGLG